MPPVMPPISGRFAPGTGAAVFLEEKNIDNFDRQMSLCL
jgi:hypothetical protein